MKISIVTAYYNRKQQFINTLKTISLSSVINDVEVIVTDDCSSDEHRLEDILDDFPFLKIIRLESKDRWYTNPSVPFNKSINSATGDIIVLQNPECLHVGDILSDVVKYVTNSNYITYGVYSINQSTTNKLNNLTYHKGVFNEIKNVITPMNNISYAGEGRACWYNHSIHRPSGYHFIGAMMKSNMDKLNGFDEKFANGIGFDDDEFLFRVKLLGLETPIHDKPFGLHQWHYSENNFFAKEKNVGAALRKNQTLFNEITKNKLIPYVENKKQ